MAKHPASMGKVPKGLGGKASGEDRGGPGTGTMPTGINNTRGMNPMKYAGGKGHPSAGSVPRVKNPPVNTYATPGGKRTKVEKGTW